MKKFHGRVAFWLVPNEHHLRVHQAMINDLADHHMGIKFIPHVTVFSAPFSREESYNRIVKNIAAHLRHITLFTTGVGFTDKFTKTLYVEFRHSRRLASLSNALRQAVSTKSNYTLAPHLSLLYAHMNPVQQASLAAEIKIPRKKIVFTQLKAMAIQTHVHSHQDVKSWIEIASAEMR